MDVYRFKLDRARLNAAAEDERTLFLLLGHFANQVAILGKWVNWCQSGEVGADGIERRGRVAQTILVMTLFAGKLFEGWELLQRQYFGAQVSKTYASLMEKGANESLSELKRYFGSGNALNTCRNEYAFHYDPAAMNVHYASLPHDEETDIFLTEFVGVSLFHVAEMAAAHSLLNKLGNGDRAKGMLKLVEESLKVSMWFQSFVAGYMHAFLKRINDAPTPTIERVVDLPKLDAVTIPFLAEI